MHTLESVSPVNVFGHWLVQELLYKKNPARQLKQL